MQKWRFIFIWKTKNKGTLIFQNQIIYHNHINHVPCSITGIRPVGRVGPCLPLLDILEVFIDFVIYQKGKRKGNNVYWG